MNHNFILVSQRLDFSKRRESLSVSKLKQKFEQPETKEVAKVNKFIVFFIITRI
jgi:hypothetical protein